MSSEPPFPSGADYARRLEALLPGVQSPGQYAGGEPGALAGPEGPDALRVALAYPDLYAIGMSHLGSRILYDLAGRLPGVAAERVFCPAPDMERALAADGLPLATLESHTPLADCDVLAFSLSYELGATGLLAMLAAGGVPLTRGERAARPRADGEPWPVVVAGGHAASNPEPYSDFVDAFFLGEAEESFAEALLFWRDGGGRRGAMWREDREDSLRRLADEVKGVYAPSLYAAETDADGRIFVRAPAAAAAATAAVAPVAADSPSRGAAPGASPVPPYPVRRRVVADLESFPPPAVHVVPISETVHERVTVEIMRGCPNGCRFCQAGYITRPVRVRRPESVCAAAREGLAATGYDEIGLLALSASDYPGLDELLPRLDALHGASGVSLSLPSLRADTQLSGVAARLRSVRPTGLTLAPEAGTDRLRRVINKNTTDAQLLEAAKQAFAAGFGSVKLYFMVGLPTETDEDVEAIALLANAVANLRGGGARGRSRGGRGVSVKVSLGNFIPKPHTPFQWEGAATVAEWERRHRLVADRLDRRRCDLTTHDTRLSLLEAVLARGDRRLGRVAARAFALGARLDAWSDHFHPEAWNEAFAAENLEPEAIACQCLEPGSRLPWDHIDGGVSGDFLARERARAFARESTPACSTGSCADCGVRECERGPRTF